MCTLRPRSQKCGKRCSRFCGLPRTKHSAEARKHSEGIFSPALPANWCNLLSELIPTTRRCPAAARGSSQHSGEPSSFVVVQLWGGLRSGGCRAGYYFRCANWTIILNKTGLALSSVLQHRNTRDQINTRITPEHQNNTRDQIIWRLVTQSLLIPGLAAVSVLHQFLPGLVPAVQ